MRIPLNPVVNYRPCGECQACCTVLGIKELGKLPHKVCPNQCSSGCAIYEDRPETCRGYFCLWAMGILEGDERRRPDKLGVIFDLRVDGSDKVRSEDKKIIQVWEVWPGALKQTNADWIIRSIASKFPVVLRVM